MNGIYNIFNWLYGLLLGGSQVLSWFTRPLWMGWTPLGLLSVGGLFAFVGTAIVKWMVS